jgi:hypothetical protein
LREISALFVASAEVRSDPASREHSDDILLALARRWRRASGQSWRSGSPICPTRPPRS